MAALPKRRLSTYRKGKRRKNLKLKLSTKSICPNCGQPKLTHYACPDCGYYKKRK